MSTSVFRERVSGGLKSLRPQDRRALIEEIRFGALKRKITYEYDKAAGEEPIRILFPPVFIDASVVPALHEVCLTVARACEKALALYLERPEVRVLFPLEEEEVRLIFVSGPKRHAQDPVIWQRLDAAVDPAAPIESLRFMETNMNSVGGVYYAPSVENLALETILPKLLTPPDLRRISPNDNLERMLFDLLTGFARRRCKLAESDIPRIAVIENDPDAAGCTESPAVAEGLCALGADAFLARPEEIEIRGTQMFHLGRPVDILYRLFEIREMKDMPRAVGRADPLQTAIAAHRVVSSLGGDFDHKSIFELFTSQEFDRFFSSGERRIFGRHVLWTRLLRETFTSAPDGSKADLPDFAYHSRERLVLKPNRSYGGDGILVGPETDDRAWQSAVERAMRSPETFVVQAWQPLPKIPFSIVDPAGDILEERLNIVFGFSATDTGFGAIGRASRSGVVNVARHGGLVPVLRLS